MGIVFVGLGGSTAARLCGPRVSAPVIRGVQPVVGLLFLKIAWGLVTDPPASFSAQALDACNVPPAAVALFSRSR